MTPGGQNMNNWSRPLLLLVIAFSMTVGTFYVMDVVYGKILDTSNLATYLNESSTKCDQCLNATTPGVNCTGYMWNKSHTECRLAEKNCIKECTNPLSEVYTKWNYSYYPMALLN